MRVGVLTSVCVGHDAISAAAVGQAERIATLPGVESVHLFTSFLGRPVGVPVTVVNDAWELSRCPAFRDCGLLIVHWGILNPLMDVLWLVDGTRQHAAVHFHNVTPQRYVHDEQRPLIEDSLRQITMVQQLDLPVWTYSEFNRRTLDEWGIGGDQVEFVPFAVTAPRPPRRHRTEGPLRVLAVGRLVRSKGLHTLIEAAHLARTEIAEGVEVTICGSAGFSDELYARELHARAEALGPPGAITFLTDLDNDALWEQYERTDVLASPSLHEGFCVPVLEAYLAGAHVIGTAAGNLPYIVQPPDPIVSTGSPEELATALVAMATARDRPDPEWEANVAALIERYSADNERRALDLALGHLRTGAPAGPWPGAAREAIS